MSLSPVPAAATRKTWWAALLLALALTGALAPRAGAVLVHKRNGQRLGVLPARGVDARSIPGRVTSSSAPASNPSANGNLEYHNGPVLHAETPYLIFWDPNGRIPSADRLLYERFFADSAADSGLGTNVYAVDRQFTDTTGFAGYSQTWSASHAISDNQPYPTSGGCSVSSGEAACLYDSQIQAEVARLVNAGPLPAGTTGSAPIYFVVTPPDVNSCFDPSGGGDQCATNSFCAYHSSFTIGASAVLYADIPTLPAATNPKLCQADNNTLIQSPNGNPTADVVIKYMSHEDNETVTDPLGTAWFTALGNENGDNCNAYSASPDPTNPNGGTGPNAFLPTLGGSATATPYGTLYDQLMNGHQYYTQSEWSNGDTDCKMQPTSVALSAKFSALSSAAPDTAVAFDPSASLPSAGYTSTTWNFGDGTTMFRASNAPVAATHYFRTNGTFTVTLTLVDAYGNLATISHAITVSGVGAHFTYPAPPPPQTNTLITFNGSGSVDSYGQLTDYSWSFDGGTPISTGTTPTIDHWFATPGSHAIQLTVSDGTHSASSIESVVIDAPPSAVFAVTSAAPAAGSPVAFDGTGSSESHGTIASYSWDFGDGSSVSTGSTPSHTYDSAGTYRVTLTVTDQDGYTATVSHLAVIDNPPTASFSVPAGPRAGSPVAFDGSASNEPGGSIAAYSWAFGDGSAGGGAMPSHTYASPGAYTVTLNVTDAKGRTASAAQTVNVAAALPGLSPPTLPPASVGSPTAAISVATAHPIAGGAVAFSGSGASDRGSTLTSYSWSFGDGSRATGVSPRHGYRHPGGYTVTLTVRDASGATATTSRRVTVGSAGISRVRIRKGKQVERLTVSVSGPGTLTSGKLRLKLRRPGSRALTIELSTPQRHRLASHHSVTIALRLRFRPTVGSASSRAVRFEISP